MLKNGKTGNRNGQQNRHKKWPKPKIPTPPSRKHASLHKDHAK